MSLNHTKLIASAVRAGAESARRGETTNPFEGVNEELRIAFHFGWSAEQPMGDRYYPVDVLLRLTQTLVDMRATSSNGASIENN
ncbi:hypothetical protein KTD31_02010 [Burkholderia multivorans]|jgi:hypothetical protein|uniref:hypothetical protein n=1 Tax=Burkholderia multivorans TaxID=87883 RepID=UPI001C21EC69|nr:hypothetical protein [Burkholderia multivorans]MBU9200179.1 hypothetical protein [Burkholderia multivorans]